MVDDVFVMVAWVLVLILGLIDDGAHVMRSFLHQFLLWIADVERVERLDLGEVAVVLEGLLGVEVVGRVLV